MQIVVTLTGGAPLRALFEWHSRITCRCKVPQLDADEIRNADTLPPAIHEQVMARCECLNTLRKTGR